MYHILCVSKLTVKVTTWCNYSEYTFLLSGGAIVLLGNTVSWISVFSKQVCFSRTSFIKLIGWKEQRARKTNKQIIKLAVVKLSNKIQQSMSDLKPPTCVSVKKASLSNQGFKSFLDWSCQPGHLYIGRSMSHYIEGAEGSKWQNTFTVKKYGLVRCLELYEEKVRNTPELMGAIRELEGLELGCWCKPEPCHGDVLIKLFKARCVKSNC